MKSRIVYLVLSILGAFIPLPFFFHYLGAEGYSIEKVLDTLLLNGMTVAIFFGIIIATIALLVFIVIEGMRMGMDRLWAPVAGTLLLGAAFGLPLFLYMREMYLEKEDVADEEPPAPEE